MTYCNRLILLTITLALSACSVKDIDFDTGTEDTNENIVHISIPESRISLGEKDGAKYPIYWNEDDCIGINGIASQQIEIKSDDRRSASFGFGENKLEYPYYITYPYTSISTAAKPMVVFPTEQYYKENSISGDALPMCGYAGSGGYDITMKHLASILRISVVSRIEDVKVSSITVTSLNNKQIAGEFSVNCRTSKLTATENTSNSVTYHLPEGYTLSTTKKNIFFISIAAGAHGDCEVVLNTESGNDMTLSWASANAKAGIVHEFKDVTYTIKGTGLLQGLGVDTDSFIHEYDVIRGYVRDTDGNPIEGVAVSDGFSVTTTDSTGHYTIKILQDAWYIYISVPAEYKIPINNEGYPCFFMRYPGFSDWYNFTLERLEGGKEKEFMLFGFADPQVSKTQHIERFSNQVAPEVKSYSASLGVPCYGITLGDVISMGTKSDISYTILPQMKEAMHADKMGMPVFQVMGNHDNCYMTANNPVSGKDLREINLNIQRMFETTFGPINYSFNRGDAHIVGMRNIQWKSGDDCSTDNTRTAFTEEQYNWLKQDLAVVPKDKVVVLCVHIPLYNNGTIGDGSYRQEVLNLLDEFAEAHVLSGHLHYQHNYDHTIASSSSHKIYEHAQAAVNGASWTSNINGDGVPNGYEVYHFNGNTIKDWYYKGYADGMNSRDYQMRLYRGNTITGAAIDGTNNNGTKGFYQFGYGEDILIANVFNSDIAWKVKVYEDGVYSGDMTSLSKYHGDVSYADLIGEFVLENPKRVPDGVECGRDFWAIGVLLGYLGQNTGSLYYKHCYQLWKYQLKNKDARIEVVATDRKGNTYRCSTITDGRDMTNALYIK